MIKRWIEKFRKKRLERRLAKGYKAMAPEHKKMAKEFECALLDGLKEKE